MKDNRYRNEMAAYAYNSSLFYRELVNYEQISNNSEAFEKLPIITKDIYVESRIPIEPMEFILDKTENNVITQKTSGSTGKCLSIDWNKEDYIKSMLPLWMLRRKYYGINVNDKVCYFYTVHQIGKEELPEFNNNNTLGFSKAELGNERLKEVYSHILEYQPVWMLLQPSTAEMLLFTAKKNAFPRIQSLKYIELSGEMLSDGLKSELKEFFGCAIANQYGSYEFNSIAYECPYGNMHIMSSNVYVETEKNDKEMLIITSLTNKRNPFIRYKIGDKGKIIRNIECKCGNCSDILELTEGRQHDYVLCEDGTKLNAYIFARAVENINLYLDDVVRQFQVIQNEINHFTVRMCLDGMSQTEQIKGIFEENIIDEGLKNALYEYSFGKEYLKDEFGDKLMYFRREGSEK